MTYLPSVCVVILNWNGRDYLPDCLSSVYAQSHAPEQVVLLDNGSTDSSITFVRENFPHVDVREFGSNLGYAAGNNAALRELRADIALLLNPDVVLSPDFLRNVVEVIAGEPAIGIAGGKLWYPGGEVLQHGGGYITHPRAVPGHYGIGERDQGQHDVMRQVDYVIGAAMAIRREVLERIGLFDETFFLYYEDVDLCLRARAAGFQVVYLPAATAIHVESATAKKGSPAYLRRFHTGRWIYLLKHFVAEELLGETVPQEIAWLARLDASERQAVSIAYLTARYRLPDIWLARERQGAGQLSLEDKQALERSLADLYGRARPTLDIGPTLRRLSATAPVEGSPFISRVPLIGPLIAAFRTQWNNVASRWYIDHFLHQQAEFNRLAAEQLLAYGDDTSEQVALLEQQIVERLELERQLEELKARISDLERSLNSTR